MRHIYVRRVRSLPTAPFLLSLTMVTIYSEKNVCKGEVGMCSEEAFWAFCVQISPVPGTAKRSRLHSSYRKMLAKSPALMQLSGQAFWVDL